LVWSLHKVLVLSVLVELEQLQQLPLLVEAKQHMLAFLQMAEEMGNGQQMQELAQV
jgi:hypothetical protein